MNISGACVLVTKGECGSGLTKYFKGYAGEPTKLEGQKVFSVKKDVLKHFKNLLRCYH